MLLKWKSESTFLVSNCDDEALSSATANQFCFLVCFSLKTVFLSWWPDTPGIWSQKRQLDGY